MSEYESEEVFYPPGEMEADSDTPLMDTPNDEDSTLLLSEAEETTSEESAEPPVAEEEPPPKPKRTRRKKAVPEPEPEDVAEPTPEDAAESEPNVPSEAPPIAAEPSGEPPAPVRRRIIDNGRPEREFLTIQAGDDVESEEARDDIIWHEIHNAYRTRRMLTGQLGGIEQTDNGKTVAVVDYKGFRILIPMKEMMVLLEDNNVSHRYADMIQRQIRLLNNMLGAEIDFIVRGIDSNTRAVVASRKDAMLKKRQTFYLDINANGKTHIYESRKVQARVIAVAEKAIRIEVFGVECSIMARDLAWHWIGDAHDHYSVGDAVLVRVSSVQGNTPEDIRIKADIRSLSQNDNRENLKKCRVQSRYAGKVTDVRKGIVYLRLVNGVNAIAHSCLDYRRPGKKDDVSFAVTKLDEEQGVAVGIITRIIRQNL